MGRRPFKEKNMRGKRKIPSLIFPMKTLCLMLALVLLSGCTAGEEATKTGEVDTATEEEVIIVKDFGNIKAGDTVYFGSLDHDGKSETEKEELKNFSIVTFNHLLEGKDIGTIGIIGPTRMDYSKVISVMKYISKKINDDFKNGKF